MRGDLEWGSIPRLVRSAADRFPGREAVVDGRTRISYAALGERVERASAATIAAGVAPGDRVAVWAPNTADWITAALGAVAAGAVLVPLNTRFKGAEAAYVLRRTRAKLLFITGTFLGTSYVASLRRVVHERPLPDLEQVVVLSDAAPAPAAGGSPAYRTWKDFLADGDAIPPETVRARADAVRSADPSDLTFTSGTTGHPKGVVITHAQTLRVYETWSEVVGLTEGDRYLIVNPFFHTFGYKAGIIACLMRGATMIPQPVFDVGTALANIATERVSVLPPPAHPPPGRPRPSGARVLRSERPAPGRHRRRRRPPRTRRAAPRRAQDHHCPDRLRPHRSLRHRHHVPPHRRRRGRRLHLRTRHPRHRGQGRGTGPRRAR
jgi:acyl-CoA synthetase (AMP-forming)/AMP-acid ligase II